MEAGLFVYRRSYSPFAIQISSKHVARSVFKPP